MIDCGPFVLARSLNMQTIRFVVTIVLLAFGAGAAELREIEQIVQDRRADFLEAWNERFRS